MSAHGIRGPNKGSDDINIQIGIYRGLGLSGEDQATILGFSVSALGQRLCNSERSRLRINQVEEWTKIAAAKTIAKKIQALETKADIKGRISKKAYDRLEELLDRRELDAILLGSVKEGLDRTEGKSLDRKAILQRNETVSRVEIDSDELTELLDEVRKLNASRNVPLLTEAQEAELVPSN